MRKLGGIGLVCAALIGTALPAHAGTVAYVSCADSPEIDVFSVDEGTGAVALVQRMPVSGTVMPMAISPDHRRLYAGLRSKPYSVSLFDIDRASGRLSVGATQPLADSMAYLSLDRTGRTLFGASYGGNLISTNRLDAKGAVDPAPVQVIATKPMAHSILADPSNKYVFATNLGGDIILQYRFDAATSRLTPNTPPSVDTAKGAGPRFLLFSPDHRFVYATNELGGTLDVYAFDKAKGTLAPVQTVRVAPDDLTAAPATADLHITPDGRFLFASERTSNSLAGFRIDKKTGHLTLIGRTPTETQPRGFGIDPQGRYLLAVGQKSDAMTVYAIDHRSGALKPVQHAETGKNPNWIEFLHVGGK